MVIVAATITNGSGRDLIGPGTASLRLAGDGFRLGRDDGQPVRV